MHWWSKMIQKRERKKEFSSFLLPPHLNAIFNTLIVLLHRMRISPKNWERRARLITNWNVSIKIAKILKKGNHFIFCIWQESIYVSKLFCHASISTFMRFLPRAGANNRSRLPVSNAKLLLLLLLLLPLLLWLLLLLLLWLRRSNKKNIWGENSCRTKTWTRKVGVDFFLEVERA